jgi:hypothetical protein
MLLSSGQFCVLGTTRFDQPISQPLQNAHPIVSVLCPRLTPADHERKQLYRATVELAAVTPICFSTTQSSKGKGQLSVFARTAECIKEL